MTDAAAQGARGSPAPAAQAQAHFDLDELLEQFRSSALPSSSRVDHSIPQLTRQPVGLWNAWKYFTFVASQASNVATAFLSHHVHGPAKPSWGIEMTLFTTFLRNSVAYSHLSSIGLLRRLLDLGQVLPTPKDGIVTPVSFRAKRRGLTGFLAPSDDREDGQRELTAEWVINRKLWKQMQDEYRRADAASSPHISKEQVIYYLHGGAYYVMSAASHRFLTIQLSKYTDSRLFALNYRLAPETRFPGALLDAVYGYFRLVYDLRIPSENIVVAGDSAGAGLCAALLLYLRDEGYPLPSGAVLMSPWVDLTMSCSSWESNAKFDYLPQPKDDDHLHPVKCYFAQDEIAEFITHPYASPLFGDFKGLPPMLIQCGDAERLRDEGTLLAHKASLAGVQIEHEIYEDCVHVFQMFGFLEATRKAMRSIRRFTKSTLPSRRPMENSQIDSVIMAGARAVREEDAKLELEPEALALSDQPTTDSAVPEEVEEEQDAGSQAALTASRLMLDTASGGKTSRPAPAPSAPSSPSRVLRRLPSNSFIMSPALRPADSRRKSSMSSGSLRVRPRSNSHPSLRALMDEFDRSENAYESGSDGETGLNTRRNAASHNPAL